MTLRLRNGRVIGLSDHAVSRYAERLLNGETDYARALSHMRILAAQMGHVDRHAPEWMHGDENWDTTEYLFLGPEVVCPLVRGRAVTTLVRGCIPEEIREARNRRRAARTKGRRIKTSSHAEKRRPRVEAPSEDWAA